jgi:hypothetical protein
MCWTTYYHHHQQDQQLSMKAAAAETEETADLHTVNVLLLLHMPAVTVVHSSSSTGSCC